MTGCMTLAADDPAYRAALAHRKSTPAVRPRVLQSVAAAFRQQAAELEANWPELTPADREWWVTWANDELKKPGRFEKALGAVFFAYTLFNYVFHRDDLIELLTAAGALRNRIFALRSREVWEAAKADSGFTRASALGFEDLEAGRITTVALKDL
jgi:hypothetical protein